MAGLHTVSEDRIKVFVPGARHLTDEEVRGIPEESKEHIPAGKEGVWLEVACPDRDCVVGDGKIALQVICARDDASEGVWMKLFCPEDSCFAEEATDIPS
jgi:hypothetical protein